MSLPWTIMHFSAVVQPHGVFWAPTVCRARSRSTAVSKASTPDVSSMSDVAIALSPELQKNPFYLCNILSRWCLLGDNLNKPLKVFVLAWNHVHSVWKYYFPKLRYLYQVSDTDLCFLEWKIGLIIWFLELLPVGFLSLYIFQKSFTHF